jgi:hypothetical protein
MYLSTSRKKDQKPGRPTKDTNKQQCPNQSNSPKEQGKYKNPEIQIHSQLGQTLPNQITSQKGN